MLIVGVGPNQNVSSGPCSWKWTTLRTKKVYGRSRTLSNLSPLSHCIGECDFPYEHFIRQLMQVSNERKRKRTWKLISQQSHNALPLVSPPSHLPPPHSVKLELPESNRPRERGRSSSVTSFWKERSLSFAKDCLFYFHFEIIITYLNNLFRFPRWLQ